MAVPKNKMWNNLLTEYELNQTFRFEIIPEVWGNTASGTWNNDSDKELFFKFWSSKQKPCKPQVSFKFTKVQKFFETFLLLSRRLSCPMVECREFSIKMYTAAWCEKCNNWSGPQRTMQFPLLSTPQNWKKSKSLKAISVTQIEFLKVH